MLEYLTERVKKEAVKKNIRRSKDWGKTILEKALYYFLIYAINKMMFNKDERTILIVKPLQNEGRKNGRDTTF